MTPPAGPIRAVIARALLTIAVGYEKGYHVITLSDCLAATSMEEHENAIKLNYPMFAEVMRSLAFAEQLDGAAIPRR